MHTSTTSFIVLLLVGGAAAVGLVIVIVGPHLRELFKLSKKAQAPSIASQMKVDLVVHIGELWLLLEKPIGAKISHAVYLYRSKSITFVLMDNTEVPLGLPIGERRHQEVLRLSKRINLMEVGSSAIKNVRSVLLLHQHAFLPTTDENVKDGDLGEKELDAEVVTKRWKESPPF
jgi:hypothetical protein